MEKRKYYLAYGSNLCVSQMKKRCPDAQILGVAKIPGHRLSFRGNHNNAYLTIEPKKGKSIPVGVWLVTDDDEKRLDTYEGYPIFYRKKEMRVRMKVSGGGTKRVTAFVYFMRDGVKMEVPSRIYWETCVRGYRNFKFDEAPLLDALAAAIFNECETV